MTVALVPVDLTDCPDCATPLNHGSWEQPALLRHGGYGATTRTVLRSCGGCGWRLVAEHGEVWP